MRVARNSYLYGPLIAQHIAKATDRDVQRSYYAAALHKFLSSHFARRFQHANTFRKYLISGRLLSVLGAKRLRRHILRNTFSGQARASHTGPLLSDHVNGHLSNLINRLRVGTISNGRFTMLLGRHVNQLHGGLHRVVRHRLLRRTNSQRSASRFERRARFNWVVNVSLLGRLLIFRINIVPVNSGANFPTTRALTRSIHRSCRYTTASRRSTAHVRLRYILLFILTDTFR